MAVLTKTVDISVPAPFTSINVHYIYASPGYANKFAQKVKVAASTRLNRSKKYLLHSLNPFSALNTVIHYWNNLITGISQGFKFK